MCMGGYPLLYTSCINMKKLLLYFFFHFFVIFTSSVYLGVTAYYKVRHHTDTHVNVPVVGALYKVYSKWWFAPYLIVSGTNTGYGFYGMNVATQKFFKLDVFDKDRKLIYSGERFGLKTLGASTRFEAYPTKISNFISETNDMKSKAIPDTLVIRLREEYVVKVAKYLGKSATSQIKDAKYYRVTLNALIPINIWTNESLTKNKIFPQKIFEFSL